MIVDNLFRARAEEGGIIADYWCGREKRNLEDCRRQIKRFKWYIKLIKGHVPKNNIDIERAKEFPIGDIITTKKTGSSGGRDYYICNLHVEKTGSLVVYKNNNTWHCFGCDAGSDSIDMIMKLNDMNFIDAVKFLS